MKKSHLLFVFLLSVTAVAIVSCTGKNSPEKMRQEGGRRQVLSNKKDVPDITLSPTDVSYLMRLENSTLILYEVKNGYETILRAVNIDVSYYPPEDIKELIEGIPAYSKEEGFLKMENFSN